MPMDVRDWPIYPTSCTPSRCECHQCTQARWKQTFQYQLDQFSSRPTGAQADPLPKE